MKILITGGCGFVGSNLAIHLKKKGFKVSTLDNLFRLGSKLNLMRLKKYNIKNYNLDITKINKLIKLPRFDFIIDSCAEPAVSKSLKSIVEAKRVFDTNLIGTFNILQKCKIDKSEIIFISTSRVYSIKSLNLLTNNQKNINKEIKIKKTIDVNYDSSSPKSLYGFTKLASEELIKEYFYSDNIKYIINRCGVVAGPWQFGKVDQGFMSLWVWRYINNLKIKYIGFGGNGHQVRDVIHIDDLSELITKQIKNFKRIYNKTFSVGGGLNNKISLRDLSLILDKLTNSNIQKEKIKETSIYDIPYFVASNSEVSKLYNWLPKKNIKKVVLDILNWQKKNKNILKKYF